MAKQSHDLKFLEQRRKKAAELFRRGYTKAQVAVSLGVSRTAAGNWHSTFVKSGLKGLEKAESTGRKRSLNKKQQEWLRALLVKGALSAGFTTDLWTLKRVMSVIKENAGVSYTESGAWRLLGRLGFSCQRPVTKAIQRDEEKIQHWKKYRWREIKKKRDSKGA